MKEEVKNRGFRALTLKVNNPLRQRRFKRHSRHSLCLLRIALVKEINISGYHYTTSIMTSRHLQTDGEIEASLFIK